MAVTSTAVAALAAMTIVATAAAGVTHAASGGAKPAVPDGRLVVAGDGARLELSLPAGAWRGVDDDRDGRLSATELRAHGGALADQARAIVQLLDAAGPLPLEQLAFAPESGGRRVRVRGRFALALPGAPLRLRVTFAAGRDAAPVVVDIVDTAMPRARVLVPGAAALPLAPTTRERWARAWGQAVARIRAAGAAAPFSARRAGAAPAPATPSRPARRG